jgi:hypothetical protein
MDVRKVRRLASVLVASQLRAGRGTTDPSKFTGQPIVLLLLDIVAFVGTLLIGIEVLRAAASTDPSFVSSIAAQAVPFLPLLVLGGVMVAGVMFELTATARFATSDAVNWLPITTEEYVLGSCLAVAYSDSVIFAFTAAVAIAVGVVTGQYVAFGLAAVLCLVALLEGGVLVEILRAATQRAAGVTGRAGRTTIVLRAAIFLVVVLSFQLFFNPIFLLDLLHSLSAVSTVAAFVPFLWASYAVGQATHGAWLLAGAFAVLQTALVVGLFYLATRVRGRYWAPAPVEMRLEAHTYFAPHPFLALLGLSRAEAALVSKDLEGLVRRREMLPVLVLPIVLAIVLVVDGSLTGGGLSGFGAAAYAAWIAGFGTLLLATASFGQERRAVQHLYMLPIPPNSVFRAKLATVLLVGSALGIVFSIGVGLAERLPVLTTVGLVFVSLLVVTAAGCLGLAFASRYSDFQERPRPQFLRPYVMIVASFSGIIVNAAVAIPSVLVLFAISSGQPFPFLSAAVAAAVAGTVIAATATLARSGTRRLLAEMPT